ncbi:MAG: hypothetical protein AAFO07_24775, partial [Bacteroidota bacterium]
MKAKTGLLLLVIIGFLFLFFRFNDFFRTPNSRVVEPYGDGFKAYTVIWYHAKYDSTYSHFEGMNYPYGDHAVSSATQPIVSNTIKWISRNFYDISDYTIGIVNLSMLLSFLACMVVLYLIFVKLGMPVWYSILIAFGVGVLSPQTYRILAHYGLAHPVVMPLIFYLWLLFQEKRSWKYSVMMGLTLWFFAQVHFYYFAIIGFAVSLLFLFDFLLERMPWKKLPNYAMHYGIQIVIPLIYFFVWLYANDTVEDRNQYPWGFFAYRMHWEGLFTSLTQPHFRAINKLIEIRQLDYEAKSYLGFVAALGFLILLLRIFANQFRKLPLFEEVAGRKYLNTLFFTGISAFIFSLGIPFIIPGLEGLLDYTGPLRQFRSIARFAWIFFYTSNIIMFVMLFHWFKNSHRYLIILAILILGFEAYNFNIHLKPDLDEVKEFEEGQRFSDIANIDFSKYQAIQTVPYYNIGSDNFWWEPEGFILQKSLTLSVQTGLPVTSAMLTRTSLSHTINLLQFAIEPY